ncbi:peptide chain release factor N(5)-glutamine methyltransferase [Rhizobacter sp. P5_C2]
MSASTVDGALAGARGAGLDRLDAQLLLGAVLGRERSWLIAHGDDALAPEQAAHFDALVMRRSAGEPVAYLLGRQDFHGLTLQVSPAVLVPRPDTETLVDWALELLATELAGTGTPQVLDLGTGSGAIALALKHRCPRADLTAVDASPEALAVAEANAGTLGLALALLPGHWWTPVAGRHFDLVVGNPPYIAGDDHHLDALQHEPLLALTPGGDGLDSLREIIAGASAHLRDGSWLLLEHGHDQARDVQALLAAAGLHEVATRRDLGGNERCTGGRWRQATR